MELSLQSWNIEVGSPTDIVKTASDVLNGLKKGMAGAEVRMNSAILRKIQALFTAEIAGLHKGVVTPAEVNHFVTEDISITFMTVAFLNNHSWNIRDDRDMTIVLFGDPCIGFGPSLARRELVPANSARSAVTSPRT